jgi:tRNA(Arg) A34 adenosine deaminase TadA
MHMTKARTDITAIIYDKRGKILSIGKNSYTKTHPLMKVHGDKVGLPEKIFLHAEVHAIARCKDLSKAHKIVVLRFGKNGAPLIAKPCAICQSAIKSVGIEHIEHT